MAFFGVPAVIGPTPTRAAPTIQAGTSIRARIPPVDDLLVTRLLGIRAYVILFGAVHIHVGFIDSPGRET